MVETRPGDGTYTSGGLCGATVVKTSPKTDEMGLNGGFLSTGERGEKSAIGVRLSPVHQVDHKNPTRVFKNHTWAVC